MCMLLTFSYSYVTKQLKKNGFIVINILKYA